jgi:hypothetical protein
LPVPHSAFVVQICALARPPAGHVVPAWQVIVKSPLVSVTLRQQISPSGQSLFSAHSWTLPAQVAPEVMHVSLLPLPLP